MAAGMEELEEDWNASYGIWNFLSLQFFKVYF